MQNLSPTISINKLGEYVNASPAKKRNILKSIKFSDLSKCARYTVAKSTIIEFMLDEKHDINVFKLKQEALQLKQTDSDWKKNDKKCSSFAMKQFEACSNTVLVPFLKFISKRGISKNYRNTTIKGVVIHLNPDLVLLEKETENIIGVIKLVFSKRRDITPFEGQIISGLIQKHMEKVFHLDLDISKCVAFDIFHKKIIQSPSDFNYHRTRLANACEEICRIWPKITE